MTRTKPLNRTVSLLGCALAAALLAGCAGGPPAGGGTYESAAEVKDAFVKAGGTCDDWIADNKVLKAKSSGNCGEKFAIAVYDDPASLTDWRALFKSLKLDGISGKNWAIAGKVPEDVQKKLGGDVITGKP